MKRNYLVENSADELEVSSKKLCGNEGLEGYMLVPYEIWDEVQPANRVFAMSAYGDSKIQLNDL